MRACRTLLLTAILLTACDALAEEKNEKNCLQPTPVASLNVIRDHPLAVKTSWGYAVVDNDCNVLNRNTLGKRIYFYLLPPTSKEGQAAYVYIKSYRHFTNKTWDKIKMSRNPGWYSSTRTEPLDELDEVPFRGTLEKWNEAHGTPDSPEGIDKKLGLPWHAYADPKRKLSSLDLMAFWEIGPEDSDLSNGTLTNYLIRFPSNSETAIYFYVGYDSHLTEFRLDFYSSIDALSTKTYRFVLK